jgi:hypothetical protein
VRSLVDFNRAEWRVLVPLATAGFFEVYDIALLTLAAPQIAHGLGVSVAVFGIAVAVIRLFTLGALPFLRLVELEVAGGPPHVVAHQADRLDDLPHVEPRAVQRGARPRRPDSRRDRHPASHDDA